MATIHDHNQESLSSMRTALDSACHALAFADRDGVVDDQTRTVLARSILEHASTGVHSPALLSAHALGQLQPRKADYMPWRPPLHLVQ